MEGPTGKLLRVKEAAERLGVSVRTVYREVSAGMLQCVKVRNCTRIPEQCIAAYQRRQMRGMR